MSLLAIIIDTLLHLPSLWAAGREWAEEIESGEE